MFNVMLYTEAGGSAEPQPVLPADGSTAAGPGPPEPGPDSSHRPEAL